MNDMDAVDTKSAAVRAMAQTWEMIEALLGGTDAMRRASTKFLPRWPSEPDDKYQFRLKTSTCYPAYSDTISRLSGRPFSRKIAFDNDPPETVAEWLRNADRQGRDINAFMYDRLHSSMAYGMSHALVEFPVNKGARNVDEERKAGLRPYLVPVNAKQLIGWRADERGVLSQLRYMEEVTEPDGAFGEKAVDQIRVLTPGKWATYRRSVSGEEKGRWTQRDSGTVVRGGGVALDFIPFVTFYAGRMGFMVAEPPLQELAHMNVKHWQQSSDQDNLMHVARVPLLNATGVDDHFDVVVGASVLTKLPQGATLGYAEHSGAAIGAGKTSLDDLKEEMRQAGAQMMVPRPGPRTATEVHSEDSASLSDLQRVVEGMSDSLNLAIDYMIRWTTAGDEEAGIEATIYKEFGTTMAVPETAGVIQSAATQGIISRETAFSEMKRRGLIDPDLTWEDEQARMSNEGPPAGAEGGSDGKGPNKLARPANRGPRAASGPVSQ